MGQRLKELYYSASKLKQTILTNNNIDILLYLAKYNPGVTRKDIGQRFGEESLGGLKELEICNLVKEEKQGLALTDEGIFQVEGLLSAVT